MPYTFDADTTIRVDAAFGVNPMSTVAPASWTEIGDYVRTFDITRGRTHELDQFAAGTLTTLIEDTGRRFDPNNTGSPYSPNVKPMTPVRVQAINSGTTYDLFHGFVESWEQQWPEKQLHHQIVMSAVDGFKVLGFHDLASTAAEEKSGVRVGGLLDEVNWPSTARSISTGKVTVAAESYDCVAVLDELRRVAQTEDGAFYIGVDGKATFESSTARESTTPLTTFSDTGGPSYSDLTVPNDDFNIWNEILVTPKGKRTRAEFSTDSQDEFGKRSLPVYETLHTTTTGAAALGRRLLDTYKTNQTHVTQISVNPRQATANWAPVLSREIWDLVRVKRNPQSGSAISEDLRIESVQHSVSVEKTWTTTYTLSAQPAIAMFGGSQAVASNTADLTVS